MKNHRKLFLVFIVTVAVILLTGCYADNGLSDTDLNNTDPQTDRQENENDFIDSQTDKEDNKNLDDNLFYLITENTVFTAKFTDNSSAQAFKDKLAVGDVTVNMHDYGNFEKVGDLGFDLPTNDTQITTQPGDIILYQGNSITVYYDTNSWNFTRLGKIENVSGEQLLSAFGEGDVTITFSLNNPN